MQDTNAGNHAPDPQMTNSPALAKVTVVPGSMDDVINVKDDGSSIRLPVHIAPSAGPNGDSITVGYDNSRG